MHYIIKLSKCRQCIKYELENNTMMTYYDDTEAIVHTMSSGEFQFLGFSIEAWWASFAGFNHGIEKQTRKLRTDKKHEKIWDETWGK